MEGLRIRAPGDHVRDRAGVRILSTQCRCHHVNTERVEWRFEGDVIDNTLDGDVRTDEFVNSALELLLELVHLGCELLEVDGG